MKDYWFKIKVSDLINNVWTKDIIKFKNKFTTQIKNLSKSWISWEIFIQSLDEKTIQAWLKNIITSINDICDICWQKFERNININKAECKFTSDKNISDEDFNIDIKNDTINIEDFIVQTIYLFDPVIKKCWKCKSKNNNKKDDYDEDFVHNEIKWIKK